MNLPNYFLADQPAEATLTPSIITEACRELRRNRERYLSHRTTSQIIHVLAEAAHGWLRHDNPFRRLALESGPASTGFPQATLVHGLDEFFRLLTIEHLHALVVQELGHAQRLDVPCSTDAERFTRQSSIATGPALLAHITAGNIPVPALMSLVQGLLVRSAQFMKCATGTSLLPRLFAHSITNWNPSSALVSRSLNGPAARNRSRPPCSPSRIASPPPAATRRWQRFSNDSRKVCVSSATAID